MKNSSFTEVLHKFSIADDNIYIWCLDKT